MKTDCWIQLQGPLTERCSQTDAASACAASPDASASLCSLTSNRALLVLMELPLDKAEDQAGFAHCRFAQED